MFTDNSLENISTHAVVVTFHPDRRTCHLLTTLARQVTKTIVVDNGSSNETLQPIRQLCRQLSLQLIELPHNKGIAYAQNIGIKRALDAGADFVLLSDQDSSPSPSLVSRLLSTFTAVTRNSGVQCPVAAVGPYIKEDKVGGDELVYVDRTWGPKRANKNELAQPILQAAFLLASGCLISREALLKVGLMNESYFIDQVDLEWCLRARAQGYQVLVNTRAILHHSLGDETIKFPLRKQPIHTHRPIRDYYLTRNTLRLVRSGLLPSKWRIGYLVWVTKYFFFNALFSGNSMQRIKLMFRGILNGVK